MERSNRSYRRLATALAVATLVAAGCYSSGTNLGGDAGDVADGDVDGGTVCEGSSHWELVPWPLASIMPLVVPSRFGATDRLRIEVSAPSGSCYRLGRVDVVVAPGDATDFVTISAFLWHAVGDVVCTEDMFGAGWTVEIEGRQHGNLIVAVEDGNDPGSAIGLRYGREMCSGGPDCACGPGAPSGYGLEGDACRTDCSCSAGLSCLAHLDEGGPSLVCGRGCSDFVDCAPMEQCLEPVPDGSSWVCVLGDQCDDPSPYCPDGFECLHDATDAPNRCVDRRAAPTVRPCTCDLDCALGELCVLGPRATPSCEIPCLRNEDCPEGWLACGTANVCVPMED